MSSSFGTKLKISIFGESHGEAIGVVIDGFPAGFKVDMESLFAFMKRRAPGGAYATPRKEADTPRFVSGLLNGVTCGAPICAIIENTNTRSGDYAELKCRPRPAHADYTAQIKYGGNQAFAGGGHFSGRLTAPLCIAGGLCLQYLQSKGIEIGAHIASIAEIKDRAFREGDEFLKDTFPVYDRAAKAQMCAAIDSARAEGDSLGGTVECVVLGMPVGVGEPMFDGLENRIAAAAFAVPAVKGIEFGSGFDGTRLKGSENNDGFRFKDGRVVTESNNHGGILGGISSGMPITFKVAIKPTPSIAKAQNSVDLERGENCEISVKGRHDPCIVPRAVPPIEAACAIAITDLII